MTDLSGDQRSALADFAKSLREQAEGPKVEQPSSVEASASSAPTPEVITQEVPAPVEPKEQPKVPEVKEPEAKAPEQELSWDNDVVEQKADIPQAVDFSKIGSALNFEVKSESDIVAKFNEIQTKLKDYETKGTAIPTVPDDLKEVIEIATKGGDWKSYVSDLQTDWTKYDPKDVFESQMKTDPKFQENGVFNEEKYWEAMDSIPDFQKEILGKQVVEYKRHQQAQVQARQMEIAERQRQAADRELAQAAQNLNKLLPVEEFGIKFEPKHSDYIYKGVNDGSLLKKHFQKEDGSYDMSKVVKTIAFAEYGEKMIAFQAKKAATQAKRELLQSSQNVQLNSPSRPAEPSAPTAQKDLSPAEKLAKWQESQRVVGRL
jgi:hypothetical protein